MKKLAMYEVDAICQRVLDVVKPEKEKQFWKRHKASTEVKQLKKLGDQQIKLLEEKRKIEEALSKKRQEVENQAKVVKGAICEENDNYIYDVNFYDNKIRESYNFNSSTFLSKVRNKVIVATLGKTTDIEGFISQLIKEFI